MKKILAFAVAAMMSLSALAEGMYVGGALGYWRQDDTNTLSILPEIGYTIDDHWTAGTVVGYQWLDIDESTHIFEFSPYARYTFYRSSNDRLSLFADGGVGLGLGWNDGGWACVWNIGVKPGVAYKLSDKFSIVAHLGMIGYEGANSNAKDGGYSNRGGILLDGNNVSFGFYYSF